jgi:hypothetical protein
LESAVTSVRYPELRARLAAALEELCDPDVHQRLWLRGQRLSSSEFGFDDTLMAIIDETDIFESLVGDILVDSAELAALKQLRSAIEALNDEIGKSGQFEDALRAPTLWEAVLSGGRDMKLTMARTR